MWLNIFPYTWWSNLSMEATKACLWTNCDDTLLQQLCSHINIQIFCPDISDWLLLNFLILKHCFFLRTTFINMLVNATNSTQVVDYNLLRYRDEVAVYSLHGCAVMVTLLYTGTARCCFFFLSSFSRNLASAGGSLRAGPSIWKQTWLRIFLWNASCYFLADLANGQLS